MMRLPMRACTLLLLLPGGCFLAHSDEPPAVLQAPDGVIDDGTADVEPRAFHSDASVHVASQLRDDATHTDAEPDGSAGVSRTEAGSAAPPVADAGAPPPTVACSITGQVECRTCAAATVRGSCADAWTALRSSACNAQAACVLSYCVCGDETCTDFCGCVEGCRPIDSPDTDTCDELWADALDCMADACPCAS